MKKIIFTAAVFLCAGTALGLLFSYRIFLNAKGDLAAFGNRVFTYENGLIKKLPIFDDFAATINRADLRKFTYEKHRFEAAKTGLSISTDDALKAAVLGGKLVDIGKVNDGYYFYGVPEKYRYLTPQAVKVLDRIADAFKDETDIAMDSVNVKFAVSSAIRPDQYQNLLKSRNPNAISESTHASGASFDLYFDDYYVQFNETYNSKFSDELISVVKKRTGFLLGDSLRREYKTALTKALLKLQKEGLIYILYEQNQACFHVTVVGSASGH